MIHAELVKFFQSWFQFSVRTFLLIRKKFWILLTRLNFFAPTLPVLQFSTDLFWSLFFLNKNKHLKTIKIAQYLLKETNHSIKSIFSNKHRINDKYFNRCYSKNWKNTYRIFGWLSIIRHMGANGLTWKYYVPGSTFRFHRTDNGPFEFYDISHF